ncbi:MAG TPA: SCO family protein [Chthoniobacterales bacterium]
MISLSLTRAFVTVTLVATCSSPLHAEEQKLPARADLEQKLGAQIPLELKFRDETGKVVTIESLFHKRPVVLQLGYYKCWLMCNVVTGALVRTLQDLRLNPGQDFDVMFVSIDPKEKWQLAARKQAEYVKTYGREKTARGWHFLTGDEAQIRALAQAVGFHYFYDKGAKQFAHPSGIMVVSPDGRMSKYFYGIEFDPLELRRAVMDASHETIGSKVQALLLLCYHWNPLTGKYGLLIAHVIMTSCIVTVTALAAFIGYWLWRDGRRRKLESALT